MEMARHFPSLCFQPHIASSVFSLSFSLQMLSSSSIQLFLVVPQWSNRKTNLGFFFCQTPKIGFISCCSSSSSVNDDSTSDPKQTQLDYDSSVDLFRLEVEQNPRNYISPELPKARSWFGPNGQYIRELPCPSCRGRGYTPCTECGIERSRIGCSQCNGKGIRTCKQCLGDSVIWEESIDERPWEKARSISPLKVKEDDEVDNLDIKLDMKKRAKRVYRSLSPEVRLKISRTLKSLNAKTGLFTKHMKILHQDRKLHAQRVAAIKKTKGTPEARKQASDVLKAYFSDPENRRKRSISMIGTIYNCSTCGREGHRRHQCPELKRAGLVSRWRCGLCGERGHNRRGCPKSKSSEPKSRAVMDRHCRVCGLRGHNSRTCAREVLVRRDVIQRHCRVCGQSGHNSRTCARGKQATEVPSLASSKKENAEGNSEAQSAALKAYYSDPDNRHKRSNSMAAYYSNPENRLKKSIITKGSKYHCSGCGREGHRRHYCPELIKAGKVSVWKCGLCKETGHNRLFCPSSKKNLISSENLQQRVILGQGAE